MRCSSLESTRAACGGYRGTNTSPIQHHTPDLRSELAEQRKGQMEQIKQWQQALVDTGLLPAGTPSLTSTIAKAGGQFSIQEQGRPPTQKNRTTPQGDGKRKRSDKTSETNHKQKQETSRRRGTATKTATQTTTTRKGERKGASGKRPGISEAAMLNSRTAQQTPSEATPLARSVQTEGRPTPTLVLPSDLKTGNHPVKVRSERDIIMESSVCCFSLGGTQLKASLLPTLEQCHRTDRSCRGPTRAPTATSQRPPFTARFWPNINLGGSRGASSAGML